MSKKIAMVLSGCGVFDGSEITEAVGLTVAAYEQDMTVEFFAPNRSAAVTQHISGEDAGEARHLMIEAARIARGKISALEDLHADDFAAVVFPGGFGAVKNFSNFLSAGEAATVEADVLAVFRDFFAAKKPIAAVCAAPLTLALAAKTLNLSGLSLTLGDNCSYEGMVAAARAWGMNPVAAKVDEAVIDRTHRVVTVPAYMYGDATPAQVFAATRAAIAGLKELM